MVKTEKVKMSSSWPKDSSDGAAKVPEQMSRYPSTRFMGSKRKLLPAIANVVSQFECDKVADLFSGSGVVSYLFKTMGKEVVSNDYMFMSAAFSRAMVENDSVVISVDELARLMMANPKSDGFVQKKFAGLYFTDAENGFIDNMRANIVNLDKEHKEAIAQSALIRACMKKRPRGIFTYTGNRYDDGRRDLKLTLEQQFTEAISAINGAVFNNGKRCKTLCGDVMNVSPEGFDLVYIDPPYYSPLSDNEYVRRYHFVEGLARNWDGVEIQEHTKTKKFKSYPTPFSSRNGTTGALERLFDRFRTSVLVVSYSSNSLPTKEEMVSLLKNTGKQVEVIPVGHRYSFGNQGNTKTGVVHNQVEEYLFVAF